MCINSILRLINLSRRTAMNAKISVFVIYVEAIIYLLLYNFLDSTFKGTVMQIEKALINDRLHVSKVFLFQLYVFLFKQHFYEQRQAKNQQKIKQKLSNTLRLNFRYLKIIRFLHLPYHPKIIGDILKTVQKPSASVLMRLCDQ